MKQRQNDPSTRTTCPENRSGENDARAIANRKQRELGQIDSIGTDERFAPPCQIGSPIFPVSPLAT